jgi:hypothetical protein
MEDFLECSYIQLYTCLTFEVGYFGQLPNSKERYAYQDISYGCHIIQHI